jgi:Lrp/AsnC family transcriptional regulator for asnA, asnC and gidA
MDDIDLKLIHLLQEDATLSSEELGKLLFVSSGTVRRRVRHLTQTGAIRIIAVVDPEKVGETLPVLMTLDVSKRHWDSVVEELSRQPQVKWVTKTNGHHNVVLGSRFISMDNFTRFLHEVIEGNENIFEYETFVALELITRRGRYGTI